MYAPCQRDSAAAFGSPAFASTLREPSISYAPISPQSALRPTRRLRAEVWLALARQRRRRHPAPVLIAGDARERKPNKRRVDGEDTAIPEPGEGYPAPFLGNEAQRVLLIVTQHASSETSASRVLFVCENMLHFPGIALGISDSFLLFRLASSHISVRQEARERCPRISMTKCLSPRTGARPHSSRSRFCR